jgi:hypothetical protein
VTSSILDEWATAVQGLLRAGHDVASSATDHGLLLGDAREVIIREVLMRFLPASVVVGTGQVAGSKDRENRSKQIDVVLYRSTFPIFCTLGLSDVFMFEGIVAAIEVKSKLDRPTLKEALDNCVSVKKLSPCYEIPSAEEYCKERQLQYTVTTDEFPDINGPAKDRLLEQITPPAYVFGYTGYTSRLKDLVEALNEWGTSRQHPIRWLPDVIATEGCVVVKNDSRPFRALEFEQGVYLAKRDPAPIKYLLFHLIYRLSRSIGMGVAVDRESGVVLRSDVHTAIDMSGDWLVLWERLQ